jgi:diguanylate cyclase (GGDEF)-like protein
MSISHTWKMMDALPDQVALLDDHGVITHTNLAWQRFAAENGGDPAKVGIGTQYLAVCMPERVSAEHAGVHASFTELLSGARSSFSLEYPCHSPVEQRWYLMRAGRVVGGGVLVTHIDITRWRLAELRAEDLANNDALTHALNRRGLVSRLHTERMRMIGQGGCLSAILIDCDDFKEINTRYGHAVGDVALIEIARRLGDALRPTDAISRIGGDEFLVLLPEMDPVRASQIANRLRLAIAHAPIAIASEGPVYLTCSLSVAGIDPKSEGLEEVLRSCRAGLDASKKEGKNRVSGESVNPRPTAVHLTTAVLRVARQPIIDLATEACTGQELLVRPEGDFGGPLDFFRQAAEHGLLQQIDMACLRACFEEARRVALGEAIHINVYPSTLLAVAAEELIALMPDIALRRRICLELSEQEIMGDPAHIKEKITPLRAAGFQIAIDDVGFGRTCLETLVLLEPDVVKIDRRFVDGVAVSAENARQLGRLVRLVRTLGASIIAEGIENPADAAVCLALGAEAAQGYLWGRPQVSKVA